MLDGVELSPILSPDAIDARLRVDGPCATLLIYGGAVVSAHTGNFSPNRIMIAKREIGREVTPYRRDRGTLPRLRPACASVQRAQNPASLSGYSRHFVRAYLLSLPNSGPIFKPNSNKFDANSYKVFQYALLAVSCVAHDNDCQPSGRERTIHGRVHECQL